MSIVSPRTLKAREEISSILVRYTSIQITMAEAEHALWRVVNDLTGTYDEGYNHGYRAAEEAYGANLQQRREPKYPEV